jgi:hypothetical protein
MIINSVFTNHFYSGNLPNKNKSYYFMQNKKPIQTKLNRLFTFIEI